MMPGAKFLLDLPVYRLTEKEYYRQREAFINQTMKPRRGTDAALRRKYYADNRAAAAATYDRLAEIYGGAWPYNEIIGFIQLHVFGTQIRGEYSSAGRQRVVRTRRKIFKWRTWKLAPEMELPWDGSNREIFAVIQTYVRRCERELPGRYVDAESLEGLGPHLDWRAWLRHGSTYGVTKTRTSRK